MKFHLRLESGKWIGGFSCRREGLAESLRDLTAIATLWREPVIATRVDKVKRGEEHIINPVTQDK